MANDYNMSSDELDHIIDKALSGYSEATPRPGLQQRLQNRIRIAESDRRRFRFLRAALAFATALLLLAIVLRKPHAAPTITAVTHAPSPRVETRRATIPPDRRIKVVVKRIPRTRLLPKEQQFPVLAPFTGAERALIALVEYHPLEAQQMADAMQRRSNEPIDIQAIQIQPLRSDGEQ